MVAGGGNVSEDNQSSVPTKTAVVVDVKSGSSVSSTTSMSVGRRQHNLTVLADGSVLATGGQSSSVDGLVDLVHPVFRCRTVGSSHRDLDGAFERQSRSGVPLDRDAAAGRPGAHRRWWDLWQLSDQGVSREEY